MSTINSIEKDNLTNEYRIHVGDVEASLFRTSPGQDKWSLKLGGFYNWHIPIDQAVLRAESTITRILTQRVESRFKQLRRDINKKKKLEKI